MIKAGSPTVGMDDGTVRAVEVFTGTCLPRGDGEGLRRDADELEALAESLLTDSLLGEAMGLRPIVLTAAEIQRTPALKEKFGQDPVIHYPALWFDIGPETEQHFLFVVHVDVFVHNNDELAEGSLERRQPHHGEHAEPKQRGRHRHTVAAAFQIVER